MDVKKIMQDYEGEEGSPIASAFELFTFAKVIPWHLGKAFILSLFLYLVLNYALYQLGVNFAILLAGLLLGLVWAIIVGMTASVNFIAGGLIGTFSELLQSILQPVDRIYDRWEAEGGEDKKDRSAFTKEVVQEFVLPELKNAMGFLPFKGRIFQSVEKFAEGIFENAAADAEVKNKAAQKTSTTDANALAAAGAGGNYINGLLEKVDRDSGRAQGKVAAPFWKVMRWGLIFWGILFALHFIF